MTGWKACASALASAIALAVAPTAAGAVQKGGTVIAIAPTVAAAGAAGDRDLAVDAPVFMGDVIRTGRAGEAQIRLIDDTKLVVGPNSYMTVDAFVLEQGDRASKVTLNAVRGAFRFITGNSRKEAYEIKTPVATIGVRGTQFDVSVDRRGQVALALFEGEAQICDRRRRCVVVSGACSVALGQRFRRLRQLESPAERSRMLAEAFPFIARQNQLNAAFQVDTSACDVQPAGPAPAGRAARSSSTGSFDGTSSGSSSFSSFGAASVGASSTGQGNNGFGNGGEGSEGSTETGNPGGGGGNGNGNGNGNQ
mgnify:CR=1 FL=1